MIIGLTGYAHSGKDTVAKILVEKHGFKRVAFADKVRELLLDINPIMYNGGRLSSLVENFGWETAKAQPEVRRLLQDLGLGARKLFGDHVWIVSALTDIQDTDNIVVTDVRFLNEANFIRTYQGSFIWRIKRPGINAVNDHISESEMDTYKVDQIFVNGGDVNDLELLIKIRMANLK